MLFEGRRELVAQLVPSLLVFELEQGWRYRHHRSQSEPTLLLQLLSKLDF